MQEFIKKAEKKFGKVQIGNVRMYDCVNVTKYVIEKMGVTNKPEDLAKDRDKVRQGWATLKNYKGVEGRLSIDEKGDGIKETYLLIIKDGKYQRLQ